MNFAAKLRTLRKRLGLSQAQAGGIIGVNQATFARYESGKRTPPAERVLTQQQILAKLERLEKREK